MAEIQLFTPLLVRVRRGRWDAIPQSDNGYSERERFLIREIEMAGGIDHTVPVGFYLFNIVPWNGKDVVTLVPKR